METGKGRLTFNSSIRVKTFLLEGLRQMLVTYLLFSPYLYDGFICSIRVQSGYLLVKSFVSTGQCVGYTHML